MANRLPRSVAAAAAKCTGATGSVGLASWGVYGLEHAQKFEPHVRVVGAWFCFAAMAVGIILAMALTIKGAITTLTKRA